MHELFKNILEIFTKIENYKILQKKILKFSVQQILNRKQFFCCCCFLFKICCTVNFKNIFFCFYSKNSCSQKNTFFFFNILHNVPTQWLRRELLRSAFFYRTKIFCKQLTPPNIFLFFFIMRFMLKKNTTWKPFLLYIFFPIIMYLS